jgi:hypothetical protein
MRRPSSFRGGARRGAALLRAGELFVLHELDPLSTAYTIAGAAALTGPSRTRRRWRRRSPGSSRRHEALRTTFEVAPPAEGR